MTRKHIKRDWSSHRKSVLRPVNEYSMTEIFSYDHIETITYSAYDKNIISDNSKATNRLGWSCYESADEWNRHNYDNKYLVTEYATYRIDLLYECKDDRDMVGYIDLKDNDGNLIHQEEFIFDGQLNALKRVTFFIELNEGHYNFRARIPVNCWYHGCIIRKIKYYWGDNLDSAGTNLQYTQSTVSHTDDTKASELSMTIGYDDAFECSESKSGFYFDYRDEINVYTRDDDGEIKQIFGGYLSSILPDANRTKLTISGADRLVDGQNKYVMDSMYLLGGTSEIEDYDSDMYVDFESYGHALKYLCDLYECTLKNNINENYLVSGEAYQVGLAGTFGTKGNCKQVTASNGSISESENFITLRNNPSSEQQQIFYLYNVLDYNIPPVDITDYSNFYITYGLGDPKTEIDVAETDTSEIVASGSVSTQFNKCGVSSDGKQLMAIGLPSASGEVSKYGYKYYKTIFVRKCPFCGSTELVWDWNWGSGKAPCKGTYEGGSAEGHIFCKSCDADFSCIDGKDHMSPPRATLQKVSQSVSSSQQEANELKAGKYNKAKTNDGAVTPESVFEQISNEAFKYAYNLSGCSSWSCMQKSGSGDCWAFSELIFTRLKERGIGCKIVQYVTQYSDRHRSVLYKTSDGSYADFPYRSYGWNTKYNNMLNNTDASKTGTVIMSYDGNGIEQATAGASGSKKISIGYDKSKPFQGFIELVFSTVQSHDAEKVSLVLNFSLQSRHENSYSGLKPIWINNLMKQASINVLELMQDIMNDIDGENHYYLHAIKIKAHPKVEEWYKTDSNTLDESSCKMDLYGFGFNNGTLINPTDLQSCGKTISSQLDALIKQSGYIVSMEYAKHRKDDIINFRVDNQTVPTFHATEGDDNNILKWNSISYTPISNLFNTSVYVYKKDTPTHHQYRYVNTKDSSSVFNYGEQITLQSTSDTMVDKEAYYKARKNEKYNPNETYTYSITIPNSPDIEIGDLVKVTADAKKLNTIKKVNSVKVTYNINRVPRVQTELGLGELSEDLQLKKVLRELRESAKKESTLFSTSAIAVDDENLYQWEN